MSNQNSIVKLIKSISGQANILTIPRIYIDICDGSHRAALFLSQSVYWSDRGDYPDGWFYKSYSEWKKEIGLGQHAVETAYDKCRELGLMDSKIEVLRGNPNTKWYRANVGMLAALIESRLADSAIPPLAETAIPPLADSAKRPLDIDYLTKTTFSAAKPPRKTSAQQEMIEALCSVMVLNVNSNASRVSRFAKELTELTITPAQIILSYGEGSGYYKVDWRGKKGQPPTEKVIRETLQLAGNGWINENSKSSGKIIQDDESAIARDLETIRQRAAIASAR
jgi:hypothetical protein